MNEILQNYRCELEDNGLSTNTVNAYLKDVRLFIDFINKPLDQLETKNINEFIKSLEKIGRSRITINRKLTSIRSFTDFLNCNYSYGLKLIFNRKSIRKDEFLPDMFSIDDFKKLVLKAYENNDLRAVAIFYTLLLTGVRVSELKQFKINKLLKKAPGKRSKSIIIDRLKIIGKGDDERTVAITEELKYHINNYLKTRKNSLKMKRKDSEFKFDELFTGRRGNLTRQTINKIIKGYAKQVDIIERLPLYHAHNFRHLCAVMLLDDGHSLDQVSKMLGHKDISTTMIYTKESFEKRKEGLDKTHSKLRFW